MKSILFIMAFLISSCVYGVDHPTNFENGVLEFKAKKYSSALNFFEISAKNNPTDVAANYNMALCFYKLENYKAATYFFEKAYALNPNKYIARENAELATSKITNPKQIKDYGVFTKFICIGSRTGWHLALIFTVLLSVVLTVLYIFSKVGEIKKRLATGTICLFIISLFITFCIYQRQKYYHDFQIKYKAQNEVKFFEVKSILNP